MSPSSQVPEPPYRFRLEGLVARLPQILAAARCEVAPLREARIASGSFRDGLPGPQCWRQLNVSDRWGERGQTYLIAVPLSVPADWIGKSVGLHVALSDYEDLSGPEALAYIDGRPAFGIDYYHREIVLPSWIDVEKEHLLVLEVYSSLMREPHTLRALELVLRQPEVEALYHDLRVLYEALVTMPRDSLVRWEIARALERAYRALDLRDLASSDFLRSVGEAHDIVATLWRDGGDKQPRTIAAGHAHIDLAWLWPVAQTRRKGVRTFSTSLRLMESYPDYHFTASQPALYQMIQEDEPSLYEEIRQRVAEGRWEPTGATWVEMDCNLPGGEALVRQFLLGKRYFREQLDVDPKVLWLPDVFGYSASLPQVLKGCEVDYFMTTKISWNEYNRLPYDTFRWRGIDGTEVLTHMPTTPSNPGETSMAQMHATYTYNAKLTPYDIAGNWQEYRQKSINDELLYLFGYGDGGGGPTAEMQETALRLRTLPGFTQVEQGSAENFFRRLEARVWDDPDLPTWVGELYFEYHRGTYTSQGWIKRANRKAEVLYHNAELWVALAALLVDPAQLQRQGDLNVGWNTLLFNQFHDILPGTAIREVYDDARGDYRRITDLAERVQEEAVDGILAGIGAPAGTLVIMNPSPFPTCEPVEIDVGRDAIDALDDGASVQYPVSGEHSRVLIATSVPPLGYTVFPRTSSVRHGPSETGTVQIGDRVLENGFFRLELDEHAEIVSLIDKRADREVIAAGTRGNRLVAYEDRPLNWDAWDIQIDYQDKPYAIVDVSECSVVETGPLRGYLEIVRRYKDSTIRQRIVLYRDVPRIDFPTEIDWRERQTLLKVAFPVTINASAATFDIQWGNLERPTHWNTSWDWARFESCAHKWVDLSEGDYGVSLLNDCKYGHDVRDNVLRLTLLKSPIFPDPDADQGRHQLTYALLPHLGDWREGETVRHAYALNMPGRAAVVTGTRDRALPDSLAFVRTDRRGLVVETIKPAEDGDGIIVRCYDAHGTRGEAALLFAWHVESAQEVNMLERAIAPLPHEGHQVLIRVRPYGIISIRLRFRAPMIATG